MDVMIEFITENYIWFIVGAVILLMTLIGYVAERTDFGHRKVEELADKKSKKAERLKKDKEKLKNSSLKLNDVVYENGKDKKEEPIIEENLETQEVSPIMDEIPDTLEEIIPQEGNTIEESKVEDVSSNVENNDNTELTENSFADSLTGPLPENLQPMEENLNAPLPEMKIPSFGSEVEENNEELPASENFGNEEIANVLETTDTINEVSNTEDTPKVEDFVEEVITPKEQQEVDENVKEMSTQENILPQEINVPIETTKEEIQDNNSQEDDNIWKF